MKNFVVDFIHFFLNHIVAHIPVWSMRRFFYKVCGMKIGRNSRILMGGQIFSPWKITIGKGSYINEQCILDGRGTLVIGDNVSISIRTCILTASHLSNSSSFEYFSSPVYIRDNVWIGINASILPGVTIGEGAIIAAGSVVKKGEYSTLGIYSGVPAVIVGQRKLDEFYTLGDWKPYFR